MTATKMKVQRVPFKRQASWGPTTKPTSSRPTIAHGYQRVHPQSLVHDDEWPCPRARLCKQSANLKLWQAATAALALTVALLGAVSLYTIRDFHRLKTEFLTIPSSQPMVLSRFHWGLHAQENGTLRAVVDPNQPVFVGTPSPEIDAAWEDLIGDRYFRLNDAEVRWLNRDSELEPIEPLPYWEDAVEEPGYYGGVDMMHSLHCINALRKHIDRDYYANDQMLLLPGEDARLHVTHCLEQLRQAILCHGDATPVTLRPVVTELENGTRVLTMLGETERLHICKDSDAILRWVKKQATERGHV